jgi:Mg-chelatase subunit ChlD
VIEEIETNPEHFKIVMIVDESGSMSTIRNDIIGSINTFITEQQKEKCTIPTTFTLIKFSYDATTVINNKELNEIKTLGENDYVPRGGTALFDAIGGTIEKWNKMKNVLMVIVTDGEENESKFYTKNEITKMIEDKKINNGWTYVY